MNEDALAYRMNRGLFNEDEQMAILVQRVSGDYYQECFFSHMAGVGNSTNFYMWDKSIDMEAGMLRLVFGLGTRAVDRIEEDYEKIVTLDDPLRLPLVHYGERNKFSQHFVVLLSPKNNMLSSVSLEEILSYVLNVDKNLFFSTDYETIKYLNQLGKIVIEIPYLIDFKTMLRDTDFPALMKEMLAILSKVFEYLVDIEFTSNLTKGRKYKINLLQCRPLQTKGLRKPVEIPAVENGKDCFFCSRGNFMIGNVHLPIDYVVFVRPQAYFKLVNQLKYSVARQIGHFKQRESLGLHFTQQHSVCGGNSYRSNRRNGDLLGYYEQEAAMLVIA